MNASFLSQVPIWVFVLFVVLVALGLSQAVPRTVTLRRATVPPLALLGLSLAGVVSSFGGLAIAVSAWAIAVAVGGLVGAAGSGSRDAAWDPRTGRFAVPGSWVPLARMMGLFATKFAVGAALALDGSRAASPAFAGLSAAAFGAFSGGFLGRAAALWSIAWRTSRAVRVQPA
jgi:hypothetical protein